MFPIPIVNRCTHITVDWALVAVGKNENHCKSTVTNTRIVNENDVKLLIYISLSLI